MSARDTQNLHGKEGVSGSSPEQGLETAWLSAFSQGYLDRSAPRTTHCIDTLLAIASKRDTRSYAERPIPTETTNRILDAGRLAGSARNRQPWRFLVVEDAEARGRLADAVYEPTNVRGARLVVAVLGKPSFDTGRAAQNMMLVAWNEGVGSCPNGLKEPERARDALRLSAEQELAIVLTFGYPARDSDPSRHTPEEWSARANRKPLAELVERI